LDLKGLLFLFRTRFFVGLCFLFVFFFCRTFNLIFVGLLRFISLKQASLGLHRRFDSQRLDTLGAEEVSAVGFHWRTAI